MPDLKVLIGGRNYNISCNPGEESAATESASLLNQEAELIQSQLGRLPEDKMLLLSGLLLGDKIRALKHERNALEETLQLTQSKLNEFGAELDRHAPQVPVKEPKINSIISEQQNQGQVLILQNISDALEKLIADLEDVNLKQPRKELEPDNISNIQDTLL